MFLSIHYRKLNLFKFTIIFILFNNILFYVKPYKNKFLVQQPIFVHDIFVFMILTATGRDGTAIAKKREEQRKKCVCHASLTSYIRDFRMADSRGICSSRSQSSYFMSAGNVFAKRKYRRKKERNGNPCEDSSMCHAFFSVRALFSHRGACITDTRVAYINYI